MKFNPNNPPRTFRVGDKNHIEISDCAHVELSPNELITFVTPSGKEYDVACKSWGFYATPSMNVRLVNQGFKTALVRNSLGRVYVAIVDTESRQEFEDYLKNDKAVLEEWLDER